MRQVFALCDVNAMYAACEAVFNPTLMGKPVVVASNNDGCAVARNKEAKALGIKMGQPIFELREHVEKSGLVVCSSNFALYGDMSFRFMTALAECAPRIMPYSIDEAFLDLTGIESVVSYEDFGHQVKDLVKQWTGLPICVGIAPSPTLSKLANHGAKKYPATHGVVDLTDRDRQRRLLNLVPAGEIWGIGSKLSKRLAAMGINTGLQLADADPKWIRKHFSVVVERTVRELNGVPCHEDILEVAPAKKQILCSKSFGSPVTDLDAMLSAVSHHATRAAEKLRKEKRECGYLATFMSTSRYRSGDHYANQKGIALPYPTSDTREICRHAVSLAQVLWRDGYRYNKAGIVLSDFRVPGTCQSDFFSRIEDDERDQELMRTLDKINSIAGKNTVRFGRQVHKDTSWQMRRANLSPAYTTRWSDLPIAKC
ncbi:translesion error-prone DNA polymerase V subunit UmuC [Marinobacter sp. F3R08]|uniref:translesion error-prone DNA polymerase V subunit UmuC n=1 Tax=Marinobacter sp. F3R08 TaxID=2841559 RepID=UPI001C0A660E|nr:translesion error-prone DNA polymerase V subunit UmuC [Marinobacter sp. F3R08]MBU2952309.1 translesion error-prone DNA polymerase V subunit UmuC [Marinobacter sp. F3R08]